jgi:hypothetical protein
MIQILTLIRFAFPFLLLTLSRSVNTLDPGAS